MLFQFNIHCHTHNHSRSSKHTKLKPHLPYKQSDMRSPNPLYIATPCSPSRDSQGVKAYSLHPIAPAHSPADPV